MISGEALKTYGKKKASRIKVGRSFMKFKPGKNQSYISTRRAAVLERAKSRWVGLAIFQAASGPLGCRESAVLIYEAVVYTAQDSWSKSAVKMAGVLANFGRK